MDPREGDIAEDGNGNYLVFRGGSWYPANEQGRPLERIPRPDYGSGFYELPNGDIVRQGPRGGMDVVERAGSTGAGGTALVGADMRGRFMLGLDPLIEAQGNIARAERAAGGNPLNKDWGAAVIDRVPLVGDTVARIIGGQDYQDYLQAIATYEASLLPIQSGAAVTPQEAIRQIRADLPQLGDSPETLARKARNRANRINAIARGIGREEPYDLNNISPEAEAQALAALRGGETAVPGADGRVDPYANRSDYRIPEGEPGYSADNPIDLSTADPASLHTTLANGGYVRYPDGKIEHVRSMGAAIPGAEEVAPGITRTTPEQTTPETDLGSVIERNVGAFAQGAAEQVPFLDEAAAGAFGALSGLGYETARARQRTLSEQDREQRGLARNLGGLAGFGATAAVPIGGATRLARGGTILQRARNAIPVVREGAAMGALYGAGSGEGGFGQRLGNALEGAAVGAVAAPFANVLARPVVDLFSSLSTRRNPLASAVDRFGGRFEPDTNALARRVDDLNAMGIEPAFVDVMDEGQRGLTRALATRQTPARQAVREFGEGRAEGLQDRLRYQARRTVSNDPRSPMEIREAASRTARKQAAPLYEQAYAQPVEISEELSSLLSTPAGRSALNRAQTIAANERRAINIEQPDMRTLDYVKRGLDDILEENRDPVTGRLKLTDDLSAVEDVRKAFRTELDRLNPTYGAARAAYGDSASLEEASRLGEDFLTMEADQFARQAGRLRPGERAVAQAGARRAIERQAGTQGRAPGVAQALSSGREQMIRNAALLDDPAAMQNAMRAEREGVMAARAINPAVGSNTAEKLSDIAGAAGAARDVFTGNVPGIMGRIGRRLMSRGFNDREAEALVLAAIDPARTREVIDLLGQRMSRSEARNLVRTARYMASQSGGRSAGDYQ